MYVNTLGMGGITSLGQRTHTGKAGSTGSTGNTNNAKSASNTSSAGVNTNSYAAILQKALLGQNTSATSFGTTYAQANNIIIREALEKMKEDPEWEDTVLGKIKEATQVDYSTDMLSGYLSAGQTLLSNSAYSPYNFGTYSTLAYSPYNAGYYNSSSTGLGALAASSYSNVMNNANNTSLLGSWLL